MTLRLDSNLVSQVQGLYYCFIIIACLRFEMQIYFFIFLFIFGYVWFKFLQVCQLKLFVWLKCEKREVFSVLSNLTSLWFLEWSRRERKEKCLLLQFLTLNSCFLNYYYYSYMYILARLTSEIGFMGFKSYGMFISIREKSHIVTALATCVPQRPSAGTDGQLQVGREPHWQSLLMFAQHLPWLCLHLSQALSSNSSIGPKLGLCFMGGRKDLSHSCRVLQNSTSGFQS